MSAAPASLAVGRVLGPVSVALTVTVLSGCTTESLEDVAPVVETFEFAGDELDVVQNAIPTDLVVADRDDIRVSLRVSVAWGRPEAADWRFEDGTLELSDPCPPNSLCDARYEVEVPKGIRVLREGEPTEIAP